MSPHNGKYRQPAASKCFPKNARLLKRAQFLDLEKNSQKIQNKHFVIRFGQGQEERTRIGVTLTKKVGNAVTRNRIKRHIREYFRNNKFRFNGTWDIILIAKQSAAGLAASQIPAFLEDLFKKFDR